MAGRLMSTATDTAPSSSCDCGRGRRRRHRRGIDRRLLPFAFAAAATAATLLVQAVAPPHNAFARAGVASGVAFQRPQPLRHQPMAMPTTQHHPQQHATPIVASPSALMGSSSSEQEAAAAAAAAAGGGGRQRKGRRWGAFTKGFLNKAQAVATSDDFKVIARGARTVLRELLEVDVGPVDMEKSMERLKRGVDRALTATVRSLEGLLQLYEGRSGTAEGVLGRVRRRIAKMVKGGLGNLMSLEAIDYCLYSVNMTALMVEEMASRRTDEARKALGVPTDEPLPRVALGQVQREVMREMVVVAEDAEAFAAAVVGSRWFRRSYCSDDEEAAQYQSLIKAKLVSRLVLAVAAGVLHGYRPTEDPLLALLVVAYACGSLTRQVAANFLGLVGTALTTPSATVDAPAGAADGNDAPLAAPPVAAVRAGDYVIDRLPDVWSAADSPEDIGEGLYRLFQALERRKGVALAKQAGSCAADPPPPTYLATAALEAAAANPAASQLAALTGGATGGWATAAGAGPSMAWSARPGSPAAGATAFLPPLRFQSTQQGSRLVLLAKSVGKVRRYWKATTVAAITTMALVWLARWFVASPATSSTASFGSPEDEEERRRMRDIDAAIAAGARGGGDDG